MAMVIINKNDTIEFLESAELAERYAAQIEELMDMDGVTVELGNPRGASGFEVIADSGDESTDTITDIYQWAADRAVNDWAWAE